MRRLDLSWFLRSALVLGLAVSLIALAQDARKPRPDEEEETPKKARGDKREEEEEKRPMKSPVLDVEDDGKGTPAPRPAADLGEAAREATDPNVKKLFESLATPADTLTVTEDVRGKAT